ncbi:MAG TPA: hypothetical protein VN710_09545 [Verrucomicrobiae bacterium]|jgi:ElaB/YqjD/DUF883 family membrane-anchored ribosome-binding protein|nr:hypothetical protein [Verrucomicrobiae bacterium]
MRRTQKASRKASTSVQHEISKMGEELADLAAAVGETASDQTKAAVASLHKRFDRLADAAGPAIDAGVADAREVIAENPFASVAAAFGLGFLLASTLLRR